MKSLLLPLLLISLNCFSQDLGRIRQSTTLIIRYEVLPNHHYDIFVQNAAKDTSVIQFKLNDSTYNVRLGYWQRHQFIGYYPEGFTLWGKNISNYFGDWMECGSVRQVDKVREKLISSPAFRTTCNGNIPFNYLKQ